MISDSFKSIIRVLNRQRPIASVVFICCFALGMLYYITTPASYTAGGTIVIDKRKLQLFQKESVLGDVEVDTAAVQTEVEVLKSDNIGLSVVRKLHLADDPEFVGGPKGPIGRLIAVIGRLTKFSAAEEALSEIDRENEALLKFNEQRTLSRVGMTYVIDIGFTSHDRDKSARINDLEVRDPRRVVGHPACVRPAPNERCDHET
jgi:succinoglycan biosynthesis transport protein ExoP